MTDISQLDKDASNTNDTTKTSLYYSCGILSSIILFVDFITPLGVASGVPYIAVVLLSLKSPEKRFTIWVVFICSLFVVIGFFASPDGGEMWKVLANRGVALFAIWITALLVLRQRDQENALHQERLRNLQTIKEVEIQQENLKTLKKTMRTVQDIVGNFLTNLQLIRLEVEAQKTVSSETLDQLDVLIQDTSSRINKLSNLDRIHEKRMAGDLVGIDYEQSVTKSHDVDGHALGCRRNN